MPVSVVQQDWGAALGYDAAELWRPWAPDLVHQTLDARHFMPEEAPGPITELIRQLLKR
jgi:haloacetate dehalogenase